MVLISEDNLSITSAFSVTYSFSGTGFGPNGNSTVTFDCLFEVGDGNGSGGHNAFREEIFGSGDGEFNYDGDGCGDCVPQMICSHGKSGWGY